MVQKPQWVLVVDHTEWHEDTNSYKAFLGNTRVWSGKGKDQSKLVNDDWYVVRWVVAKWIERSEGDLEFRHDHKIVTHKGYIEGDRSEPAEILDQVIALLHELRKHLT